MSVTKNNLPASHTMELPRQIVVGEKYIDRVGEFLKSLSKPKKVSIISGKNVKKIVGEKINDSFGDFETFKTDFTQQAVGVFGSGWAWLIEKDGKLEMRGLPNAENPLAHGEHALMGIDVWEHAYYLDYKNVRPEYVKAVLDNLINWDYVSGRLQ